MAQPFAPGYGRRSKTPEQPSVQQGPDALAFYQNRVEEFASERADMLEKLNRLSTSAADQHQLEWENHKRADEVRELQKALSDAHAFLFEERQRLLTLQAENDELRLQEIEDRKRIQQLLSAGPQANEFQQTAGRKMQFSQYSTDALLLKIESLQAQLNEQKQLAAERIAALLEDRKIREAEEVAHRTAMNASLEQAHEKIKHLEEQLRQTTKDYILAKRDKDAAEEKAIMCESQLVQQQQHVGDDIAKVKRKYERELRDAKAVSEARLDDITTALRQQLKSREEEVAALSNVHGSLKGQYEKRVAELEDKAAKLAAANKQLETRRHLDMEGFTADLTYLRKMLTAVDRKLHEMRLMDRLEDDERLDAILATLRKRAPVPQPPQKSDKPTSDRQVSDQDVKRAAAEEHPDAASMSDTSSIKGQLAQGLSDLRGRVKGLEQRLAARKKAIK